MRIAKRCDCYVLILCTDELTQVTLTSDTVYNSTNQTRYSVTDYFTTYPSLQPQQHTPKNTELINKPTRTQAHMEPADTKPAADQATVNNAPCADQQGIAGSTAAGTSSQSEKEKRSSLNTEQDRSGENGSSGQNVSAQEQLYRGTQLDTSLSTIRDTDDTVSVVSSEFTTCTAASLISIDDQQFRDGLANLDANIAKMQASLKQAMLN